MLKRLSFNDMLGKGFDSAAQESFCWQRFMENPSTNREANQFWWVPRVWRLHGHAPGWENHKRDEDGKFLKFPPPKGESEESDTTEASTVTRLLRLATLFPVQEKEKAEELIKIATILSGGRIVIEGSEEK